MLRHTQLILRNTKSYVTLRTNNAKFYQTTHDIRLWQGGVKIQIISIVTPRQIKLQTLQYSYPHALDTGVRQNNILHNVPIFKCSTLNIVKKTFLANKYFDRMLRQWT